MKKITKTISRIFLIVIVTPLGFIISVFNNAVKEDSEQQPDMNQNQYVDPFFGRGTNVKVFNTSASSSSVSDFNFPK